MYKKLLRLTLIFALSLGGFKMLTKEPVLFPELRGIPDTRGLQQIQVDSVVLNFLQLESFNQQPKEAMVCVYGYTSKSKNTSDTTEYILHVDSITKAQVGSRSERSVAGPDDLITGCKPGGNYIGSIHSHTDRMPPGEVLMANGMLPCAMSREDMRMFLHDYTSSVYGVLCRNGWMYWQFRDGSLSIKNTNKEVAR